MIITCPNCGYLMSVSEHVSHEPQVRYEMTIDGGSIPIRIQDTYDITNRAFCRKCGNTIKDVDFWVKQQYNSINN